MSLEIIAYLDKPSTSGYKFRIHNRKGSDLTSFTTISTFSLILNNLIG